MKLTIVTPEKPIFDDEVVSVSLPTLDGEITVLDHHVPLITQILPGELTISHKNGKKDYFATGGGFAEITSEQVSLLTDLAENEREINENAVEEARKRAKAALQKRELLSEEEIAITEANLLKSLAQLRVKRRHHSRLPITATS